MWMQAKTVIFKVEIVSKYIDSQVLWLREQPTVNFKIGMTYLIIAKLKPSHKCTTIAVAT